METMDPRCLVHFKTLKKGSFNTLIFMFLEKKVIHIHAYIYMYGVHTELKRINKIIF